MDTVLAEQRMHPRWILKSTVSVFDQRTKEYLGLLVDCSLSGLMISTYDVLAAGTVLHLELVDILPNSETRRNGLCTAEVVWSDKITPSLYGNGLHLTGINPALTEMIKSYASIAKR